MTGSDSVSVVIPSHGHGHYLAEAIESVLAQSHLPLEIIVVDDGSPDDTAEVASAYPSVRLLRQSRAGLAAARNRGLEAVRSRYVAFLDADDVLLPDALLAGWRAFGERPEAAFVAGAHRRVDGAGRPLPRPAAPRLGDEDPYLAFLRGNWVGMHAAVLYRTDVVVREGGFCGELPACEDYDLYLRIARDRPVHQHDAVVAEYRIHGANMSADVPLMLGSVLAVLGRQLPHVVDVPQREQALREGLHNWSRYYLTASDTASVPAPGGLARAGRRVLGAARRRVRRLRVGTPAPGTVDLGDLRRTTPLSTEFGFDRGTPVDRRYIEEFLAAHAADIRGRALEIGDDSYTRRFGGPRVDVAEVLHVDADAPGATYRGTLEGGASLPDAAFDCVILTQTLHLVYDVKAALASVARILAPGGVLLATVPGISQRSTDQWSATWSWAITPYAMRRLLEDCLPGASIEVGAHGNVLTSTAFLFGLAAEELTEDELGVQDAAYPMLVTARAVAPPSDGEGERR